MKTRAAWIALVAVEIVVVAALVIGYGRWQYRQGFHKGADSAICAFAVAMDGKQAITMHDACRRISEHDWIVDGFDPHGKRPIQHARNLGEL